MAKGGKQQGHRSGGQGQGSRPVNKPQPSKAPPQLQIIDGIVVENLAPGRRPCNCQARKHGLILNCLECGKIVCEQEGSGPCFFCGNLVCTRAEREILNEGATSKKARDLYRRITGEEMPSSEDKTISLASISRDVEKAVEFRNRLLVADADTENRTKVNDLESDWASMTRNPYLTAEERESIIKRREELDRIKEERRKAFVINIDLENRTAFSAGAGVLDTNPSTDPVIQAILNRSDARKCAADAASSDNVVDAHWVPKGFVPKYAQSGQGQAINNCSVFEEVNTLCIANEEMAAAEMERRACAISIPQPAAALLANGRLKYIRWPEDLHITGPVWVCANSRNCTGSEIANCTKEYVRGSYSLPLDYSPGCIQGRAYICDILTYEEFQEEVCNVPVYGEGKYVIAFSTFQPLTIPVPHIPPAPFFQLDKTLRDALGSVCQ